MIELAILKLKASAFLLGLSQKCIVAAIKKAKETKDQEAEREAKRIISVHELAKGIHTKVEQRITGSIGAMRMTSGQLEQILALENDPFIKQKVVEQFLSATITPESIVALFIEQDPSLEALREELTSLADAWLEAMDKVVAEDATLSRIIVIKSQRAIRADVASLGNVFAKAELAVAENDCRAQQRHEEQMAAMADIKAQLSPRSSTDGSLPIPDHLKSERQKRFDRARQHLLADSVIIAEQDFRGLVEDLESAPSIADKELLLRSYLNIGSSLWEQNKHDEAITWFDRAFTLNPADWRARRGRAIALMDSEPDTALALFRSIRIERPNEAEHACNEAIQLKNSGHVDDAIMLLESRAFEDVNYYATLALAYLNASRFPEAEAAARKALQIDPESESSQSALAYALGFPYIRRLMQRKGHKLAPTDQEYGQIQEATRFAEKAAAILRKQGRAYPLAEVVTNLAAFYSAANDCDRAISAATEVLTIRPDDLTTLTNLWCVQMRAKHYDDAADTGRRLEKFGDPLEGWERRAEALFLGDRAKEILDDWESKASDKQFCDAPDVVSVVARAFAERHRTAEGLQLLNDALARNPNHPRLLSERGLLLEGLGKFKEAAEDLTLAEKSVGPESGGQVLLDHGMFLYRRREWEGAATRFKELGAETIRSPLFTNYLICLFNLGKYRETILLADAALGVSTSFDEDQHAIAARCHLICGNLPRAKELLNALVARHTSRELEHRKILASVCWRLDELPEAYDILLKALKLKSDDDDALILISAVCALRGEYAAAFSYALLATEVAPDKVASHMALVRVGFSCPNTFKPEKAHLDAHFRSLSFLQQHESKVIRAVPFEPDLHSILELLKKRAQHVDKIESLYLSKRLPMGFFATQIGASHFQFWSSLLGDQKHHVRFAFGTTEEQEKERIAADAFKTVSVDLFALFTLQHLNLLWLLPKFFNCIYAHSSLLDAVVAEIRELQQHPTRGSLRYVDGHVVSEQVTPEQHQTSLRFLEAIRYFLKAHPVEQPGVLPESWQADHWQLLADTCGAPAIAPIIVANQKQTAFYSDDAITRAIGHLTSRTPGFCTQSLLRVATARGLLSVRQYQDALIKLVESNYTFVSEDSGTLRRAYDMSGGKLSLLALALINRVNSPLYNPESCLPLLAEFIISLWLNDTIPGADSRDAWTSEVWRAIAKVKDAESLLLEFLGKLAALNATRPGTFVGIVNWGLLHVPELRPYRYAIFFMMQQTIATLSRLTAEFFPFSTGLSHAWAVQGKVNELLHRQGFLKL